MRILFIDFQTIYGGGFGGQSLVSLSIKKHPESFVISGPRDIRDILRDEDKFRYLRITGLLPEASGIICLQV